MGTNPWDLAVGDFNLDGTDDFVVSDRGGGFVTVQLLDGKGGALVGPVSTAVGTNPEGVAVADFNNDGKLDWAVANFGTASVSIVSVGLNTSTQ